MLTVEILNNLDFNNNDDIKLLEKVEKENKEFYDYLINSFPIVNIIQVLKDKKKCYLPSGLIIEVIDDNFKISNIFTSEVNYSHSIFNYEII